MCLEKFVRRDLDLHLARLAASQANNKQPWRGTKKKKPSSFLLPSPAREQRNMHIWPR